VEITANEDHLRLRMAARQLALIAREYTPKSLHRHYFEDSPYGPNQANVRELPLQGPRREQCRPPRQLTLRGLTAKHSAYTIAAEIGYVRGYELRRPVMC